MQHSPLTLTQNSKPFSPVSLTFRNIYALVTFIRCTPQDTIFVPYVWKLSSSEKKNTVLYTLVCFIPLCCSHSVFLSPFWILLLTHKMSNSEITNLLSIYFQQRSEKKKRTHPECGKHWTQCTTDSIHKIYSKHFHSVCSICHRVLFHRLPRLRELHLHVIHFLLKSHTHTHTQQ